MNKTFLNYIYMTAYQVLLVVLPIITTPYVARVLGVDNVGTASYAGTIVSYFVLFVQGGLSIYGRREIAKCQSDIEERSKLFWQLSVIRFISFIIVFGLFLCSAHIWGVPLNLLMICGMLLVASLFDVTWLFQGLENFRIVVVRNFIIRIVGVVVVFVFVDGPEDIGLYLGISSISEVVSQLSLWLYVKKYIVFVKIQFKGLFEHVKCSWVMFIPTIFNSLYTKVDRIMLGMLTTDRQVGIYSQGEKIIDLLFKLIGSMGLVYMPALAKMLSEKDGEKNVCKVLSKNAIFVWEIGIPLAFGIAGISRVFSSVFFGNGYEEVCEILMILAPIIVLLGFSDLFGGQYMIASGKQREFNISILSGAIINIILNAIVIPHMGAIGASISTVIANFVIVVYQFGVVKKQMNIKVWPRLYLMLAGLLMFAVVKTMDIFMKVNIITLALQILVGASVYFIILILNKDKFLFELFSAIRKKLIK